MRYHLNSSWMCGCVVLALAVPAAAVPAVAEEAGQWFGRAVLVTLSSKSLEGRADHTVSVTEFDGAVFNADGKPFLDKARYQVVDLTDAGTSSGGHKTFTEADGSKVFAKYVLKDAKPKEFRGTFEFTGGTTRLAILAQKKAEVERQLAAERERIARCGGERVEQSCDCH
jgi:hypothetical protein